MVILNLHTHLIFILHILLINVHIKDLKENVLMKSNWNHVPKNYLKFNSFTEELIFSWMGKKNYATIEEIIITIIQIINTL